MKGHTMLRTLDGSTPLPAGERLRRFGMLAVPLALLAAAATAFRPQTSGGQPARQVGAAAQPVAPRADPSRPAVSTPSPASAADEWPTFHRNPERTGAADSLPGP